MIWGSPYAWPMLCLIDTAMSEIKWALLSGISIVEEGLFLVLKGHVI